MELSTVTVNIMDERGNLPIHTLVEEKTTKNVELKALLRLGANIEAQNKRGKTALHLACLYGNHHLVKVLIAEGANVEARDDNQNVPLHMAVNGSNASIELLVQAGANIDQPNKDNQTPLMMACEIGKVGAVKSLCKLGANPNVDSFSSISLVRACVESSKSIFASNAVQMVGSLVKAGARIGCKDIATGNTELHIAAADSAQRWGGGHIELLKLLINHGGNPWEKNDSSQTPLSLINPETLEVLRPALKKSIKGRELALAASIETVTELKAFYFNQTKLSKQEVFQLLKEGTPAKKHFEEIVLLPETIEASA